MIDWKKINWYQLQTADIYEKLTSSAKGLSSTEATQKVEKYGRNELSTQKKNHL